MYRILNIGAGSAREAFSTSDATVSTAELPRQDMSSENNLASSSPFQRADSFNKSSFQIYIFTSTLKLFLLHTGH